LSRFFLLAEIFSFLDVDFTGTALGLHALLPLSEPLYSRAFFSEFPLQFEVFALPDRHRPSKHPSKLINPSGDGPECRVGKNIH
jgi:hypothetical protein